MASTASNRKDAKISHDISWFYNFHILLSYDFEGLSGRGTDENAICNPDKYHKTLPTSALVAIDTVQDLLCELGMKAIILFALSCIKLIKGADKNLAHFQTIKHIKNLEI